MRSMSFILLILALAFLVTSLAGIQPRFSILSPSIDPDPWSAPFAAGRQTVISEVHNQGYDDGWEEGYIITPEYDAQGRVSSELQTWWDDTASQWVTGAKMNVEYRADNRPALIHIYSLVDDAWEPYGDVNYYYEDGLLEMILYNTIEDGISRPYWQVAMYYWPTGILKTMVEIYYYGSAAPTSMRKFEYTWDAGSRPSEITQSIMSQMGDWVAYNRDSYVYHNDDQTTHAAYMRTLEFGWPFYGPVVTGVLPSKLLEHREYYLSNPQTSWVETVRGFYVYDANNHLQEVDSYEMDGPGNWEINARWDYAFENGLPVSETWWYDQTGQDVLAPQGRMLYSYEELTDADDPVAPPAIGKLAVHPNPFNPVAGISFKLNEPAATRIAVYNLKGQKVRDLGSENTAAGDHELAWDGKDDNGRALPAGIYLIRLDAGKQSGTIKAVLAK